MKQSYSVIKLDDWEAYKNLVERFSEHWAFRGQASANWILSNAIERTEFIPFTRTLNPISLLSSREAPAIIYRRMKHPVTSSNGWR